jgi:predicted Ser/Thr protein kinase
MSVAEIEAAIKTLPKEELARFNQWYQEYLEEQWDEQIRQDVRAGKLDFLIEEAQREREAGTLRPFP